MRVVGVVFTSSVLSTIVLDITNITDTVWTLWTSRVLKITVCLQEPLNIIMNVKASNSCESFSYNLPAPITTSLTRIWFCSYSSSCPCSCSLLVLCSSSAPGLLHLLTQLSHTIFQTLPIILTPGKCYKTDSLRSSPASINQDLSYDESLSGQPGAWLVKKIFFICMQSQNFKKKTHIEIQNDF